MCDCIKLIDDKYIEMGHNTKISVAIYQHGEEWESAVLIATEKRDIGNRQKPAKLLAAYCPFCGEKLENKFERKET